MVKYDLTTRSSARPGGTCVRCGVFGSRQVESAGDTPTMELDVSTYVAHMQGTGTEQQLDRHRRMDGR